MLSVKFLVEFLIYRNKPLGLPATFSGLNLFLKDFEQVSVTGKISLSKDR